MSRLTCKTCNRSPMENGDYCFYCSPTITDEAKKKARALGGRNSRKIPHNLNPDDYRPLTLDNLRRLYEDLIRETISARRDDLAGTIRDLAKILPRASEVVAYQNMELLNERLTQLESGNHHYQLGSGNGANIIELDRES